MHNKTSYRGKTICRYTRHDNISEIVGNHYSLLLVLNRFGISMGFKEQTIEDVCLRNNVDTDTFLAIVNLLACEGKVTIDVSKISLETLMTYLKKSHEYYLEYRLPEIRRKLHDVIPNTGALAAAVLNYYDEYISEVEKHMRHEDKSVFKYVDALLSGDVNCKFNVEMFDDYHENREQKLTELKNIIIKYYPTETTNELTSVLFDIFNCERHLALHCSIEDYLFMPTIRRVEREKGVKHNE